MTIREALVKYHDVEIDMLLTHLLGKSQEFIFLHPEFILSSKHLNILSKLIKRRKKGEPIAYILGYKDFYGSRFKVNKNVLIPRPETEIIVETIISSVIPEALSASERLSGIKKIVQTGSRLSTALGRDDKVKILDVGAGSGCIIISLAKKLNSKFKIQNSIPIFYASDISKSALNIAKFNSVKHKAKIKFFHSDLLKKIPGKFDIVVANLPYVPKSVYKKNYQNLKWEPKYALIDPKKDFSLFERLFSQLKTHTNPGSQIFLEIDPLAKPLIQLLAKKYFQNSRTFFYKDLRKITRFIKIQLHE